MTASKNFRRYFAAGLVLGVVSLGGAVAAAVQGGSSPDGTVANSASISPKSGQPRTDVEGIDSRDVDPPNAARLWVAEGVTAEQIETLPLAVVGDGPFELIEPIIGFSTGLATDDDEFGRKSIECRLRFERKLAQEPGSSMKQDVAVVDGEVVYIDPKLPDDATNECRAFLRCMQEAWRGRPAPPLGDGSNSYRTVTPGRYLGTSLYEGMSDAEYMEVYGAALARIKETHEKREAYVEESKANGDWDRWSEERRNSFPHNMIMADSETSDHELMIETLQKGLEG